MIRVGNGRVGDGLTYCRNGKGWLRFSKPTCRSPEVAANGWQSLSKPGSRSQPVEAPKSQRSTSEESRYLAPARNMELDFYLLGN